MAYYDPTFDVNFAAGDDPVTKYGFSFTRATAATYVNASGLIATAASGELRYTYDPVTLSALGVLIEESRANVILSSRDIASGSWTRTDITFGSDGVSPTGLTEADLVIEGSAGTASVRQAAVVGAGVTFTASAYLKRGNCDWILFDVQSGSSSNGFRCWVDVNTKTRGTFSAVGTGTAMSASVSDAGNGWVRVVATGIVAPADASGKPRIQSASANGSATNVSGAQYYLWGVQVEVGAFPTSYIPTTGAAATRNADVLSLTGAADVVASWFNKDAGTWLVDRSGSPAAIASAVCVDDGAATNRILVRQDASRVPHFIVGSTADVTGSAVTVGTVFKTAASYAANDVSVSIGGGAVSTDATVTLPAGLTTARIGSSSAGEYANAAIARIRFYSNRIPDADLILLSNGVDLSTPRTGGGIPKRKRKPRRIVVDDVIYDVPERDLPAFIDSVIQARSVPASVEVTVDQKPETGAQQAVAPEVRLPPRGETPESLQARADALRVHLMKQQADRALLVLIDRTIARLMAEIEDEEEAAIALLLH